MAFLLWLCDALFRLAEVQGFDPQLPDRLFGSTSMVNAVRTGIGYVGLALRCSPQPEKHSLRKTCCLRNLRSTVQGVS